jgi:carbonic anhydrase
MDFRLGPELVKHLERENLTNDADIVSLAGAAKNFLDPDSINIMMKQIDISRRLHGTTEVHIMNHTDCGAYGGKTAFADEETERAKLIADMKQAAEMIKDKWPDLTVKLWMPHIEEQDHGINVWIEKIE